ncbi:RIP metalloprotease RseP [bacterium BRH_c32]|nr:MAG: RIP metalloprotease RseP [bacterium BRH_c32]
MDYIIYFVITIAILVFVHEFGHFAAAKICRMQVDAFAIGFGKRLFGYNKITKFTFLDLPKDIDLQGNTDYKLCLLPLGGYVKIAGMVDESNDTEFLDKEPQPHEFRSKPTYQKLFVITAGVLMNLLLTLAIFWGINFYQGKQIFKSTTVSKIEANSYAEKIGFQSFDKIKEINGKKVTNWEEVLDNLLVNNTGKDLNVLVERNGIEQNISISRSQITEASQKGIFLFPNPTQPYVQDVMKNSPAEAGKIASGDIFLEVNNIPVKDREEVVEIITANKQTDIPVTILRGKDTVQTMVNPGLEGKIGIAIADAYTGEFEYKTYGVFGSLSQSISNIGQYTTLTLSMMKNVITGKVEFKQAFGGPVKIAQYAAKSADSGIMPFLFFLAMLSLSLAIINIMPFPVLDGGHFVIILIEGIIKREIPIKAKIAIQNAGFVLLLILMAFIIYNDIISM